MVTNRTYYICIDIVYGW